MIAHDSLETLHYVDPPYLPETRDAGTDYKHEMTETDHRILSSFLSGLKGMVILSGYPSDLYEEMYASWTRVERKAMADGAAERTEVLWMKGVELKSPELSFS